MYTWANLSIKKKTPKIDEISRSMITTITHERASSYSIDDDEIIIVNMFMVRYHFPISTMSPGHLDNN